ncbi:MAG: hypothetical protein PHV32_07935 [Eubacteriales bacterium]|nr:hypothetical protein [Eubacteriales bacterium]
MKKHEIKIALKRFDEVPLPDKNKILSACPEQSMYEAPAYIPSPRRSFRLKPIFVTCIVLVLLASGISGYVIAAEAKEYKEAVTFFREYNLSTDGLSRSEIKDVYRDITTGKFTYGKTAEIIQKNVGGHEIFQDEPTPEDLENLWNYTNGSYNGRFFIKNSTKDADGVSYKYYSEYKYDDSLGTDVYNKSVFEKYVDDKVAWNVEFDDFYIEDFVLSGDLVFVYGRTPTWPSNQPTYTQYAHMAMLSADGELLWHKKLANDFKDEYICAMLPGENEIAVFSRGDLKYLCLSKFDLNGNVKSFHKNKIGNYGIWNAARLGDGYIVQLWSYFAGEYAYIVKVDSDGSVIDSFTYTSDDESYYITDMIEYNGNVYLSAYSVPILNEGEGDAGGRRDIAAVLNYIFDNNCLDIKSEELTKLVRDHYTAVLLVCDPKSGEPQEFYSVKGSLGGKLALNDTGKLLWDVESITDTFYSPATSSFTIGGSSYIYRYTFDKNGTILSQDKTGEVSAFRR